MRTSISRLNTDKADELLTVEIAGMSRDKIEEISFGFGIAKRLQGDGVHAGDIHRAKILAAISC